jgi:hypothetical protein
LIKRLPGLPRKSIASEISAEDAIRELNANSVRSYAYSSPQVAPEIEADIRLSPEHLAASIRIKLKRLLIDFRSTR